MNCIILAAGKNTRLDNGIPKSLLKIGEETLLERHLRQFIKFGVNKFCVVTGYRHLMLEEFISNLDISIKEKITVVHNPDFDLANGRSLYRAKTWVEKNSLNEFFYTMADHFFSETFVRKALSAVYPESILSLAVDRPSVTNAHIDLEDVTRVESRNGLILKIGKQFDPYDYFDTGFFRANRGMFSHLEKSILKGKDSISDMVQSLTELSQASVREVSGHFWNDVDTPEDLKYMRELMAKQQTLQDSL